ncbi:MAG: phenylacetate-CoA oxygenase subunit PaaC [Bacteroidia bacterium]|nr:phenylacetate-CoA oxygenase subunit PaaC [Bacteroidia bacterium]
MKEAIFNYCLRYADSSLIIGHRLSEWCGHGPILEEDIAMTNVALDLVGQSRSFYQYAAKVEGKDRTEDDLAYLRDEREYRNTLLTEQPNGDFGQTMMRQFLFDSFQVLFFEKLKESKDEDMSAIAFKSIKESKYHLRHSSQWVIRLGDGTEESHQRIQNSLEDLWRFSDELFEMNEIDEVLIKDGIAVDLSTIKDHWMQNVVDVLAEATLNVPEDTFMATGSREGKHSEHLGYLLAEMQVLPRTYPGAKW